MLTTFFLTATAAITGNYLTRACSFCTSLLVNSLICFRSTQFFFANTYDMTTILRNDLLGSCPLTLSVDLEQKHHTNLCDRSFDCCMTELLMQKIGWNISRMNPAVSYCFKTRSARLRDDFIK